MIRLSFGVYNYCTKNLSTIFEVARACSNLRNTSTLPIRVGGAESIQSAR